MAQMQETHIGAKDRPSIVPQELLPFHDTLLGKLPREIRDQIHRELLVIVPSPVIRVGPAPYSKPIPETYVSPTQLVDTKASGFSVLRVCRQLHDEFLPVLFGEHSFSFENAANLPGFIKLIGPKHSQEIQHIWLSDLTEVSQLHEDYCSECYKGELFPGRYFRDEQLEGPPFPGGKLCSCKGTDPASRIRSDARRSLDLLSNCQNLRKIYFSMKLRELSTYYHAIYDMKRGNRYYATGWLRWVLTSTSQEHNTVFDEMAYLPDGWERLHTLEGKPYYADHKARRTTRLAPWEEYYSYDEDHQRALLTWDKTLGYENESVGPPKELVNAEKWGDQKVHVEVDLCLEEVGIRSWGRR